MAEGAEEAEASAEAAVVVISEEDVEAWTRGSEAGALEAEEDSTMDLI